MGRDIQISAVVSKDTRDLLDKLVVSTGQKKAHVVEMALRHHLLALQEIPAEFIISPVIVVNNNSWARITRALRRPGKPTPALRKLMNPDGN